MFRDSKVPAVKKSIVANHFINSILFVIGRAAWESNPATPVI